MIRFQNRQQGMTLIELMISVAIMAVIASGAFQVYSNLQSAHDRIDMKADQLDGLQRFWQLFRQDASYALNRTVRPAETLFGPNGQGVFEVSKEAVSGQENVVQWSRNSGLPNIMLKTPQSELRRVAYGLDGQELYRFQWDQMDPAPDSQPKGILLLDNVTALSFRYGYVEQSREANTGTAGDNRTTDQTIDSARSSEEPKQWQWSSTWPLASDELNSYQEPVSNSGEDDSQNFASKAALMPSVIELTLQVDGFGSLTRLFEFGAPDAGAWQDMKNKKVLNAKGEQTPNAEGEEGAENASS